MTATKIDVEQSQTIATGLLLDTTLTFVAMARERDIHMHTCLCVLVGVLERTAGDIRHVLKGFDDGECINSARVAEHLIGLNPLTEDEFVEAEIQHRQRLIRQRHAANHAVGLDGV